MKYGQELIEQLEKEIKVLQESISNRIDRINDGSTDWDDCFISQRCESRGIDTARRKIELINDGGCAWFPEYATLDIVPGKDEKNLIDVTKVNAIEFPIEDKSIIDMEVTIKEKKLFIRVNNETFVAEHEDIPNQMHVGITACEGINQFYEFGVETV